MELTINDAEALRTIEPGAVRAYLATRGWRHVEEYGEHADVYDRDDAPEIVAPASSELGDYAARLSEIISILARVEKRDALQVFGDLSVAAADLIRIRAPDAEEDGSIAIDAGVTFIEQSRNLLMAAACAASGPRATYRAGSVRKASEYLEDVRIGQTERGSFVVTLLSPVPPLLTADDDANASDAWPSPEPFGRQVAFTLLSALTAIKEAMVSSNRGRGIAAFSERVPKGVSANLCEALAMLIDVGEGVDVSLSWALTRPVRRAVSSGPVRFSRGDHQLLGEAATLLRSREPRPDERLEGYIVKLSRGENVAQGRVVIQTDVDGERRAVGMDLDGESYEKVARAYDGRLVVAVEGDLRRQGHRWLLDHPRNVEIVSSATDDD